MSLTEEQYKLIESKLSPIIKDIHTNVMNYLDEHTNNYEGAINLYIVECEKINDFDPMDLEMLREHTSSPEDFYKGLLFTYRSLIQ